MRSTARILVDEGLSPTATYGKIAEALPPETLVALTGRAARELRQELHSWEAVAAWAADLASRLGRPVLLNLPNRDGSSRTIALAPAWSSERLAGYIAARREAIAEAFGPIGGLA